MAYAIYVSVNYLAVIRKPLYLAALFTPTARTVCQINCIENRTMVSVTLVVTAYSQEQKRSIR